MAAESGGGVGMVAGGGAEMVAGGGMTTVAVGGAGMVAEFLASAAALLSSARCFTLLFLNQV